MIPIALGLIVKAATVVRAVQAISSALRPAPKPPVSESVPRSENVLCGRFEPTRDKYRYCGNSPVGRVDPLGLRDLTYDQQRHTGTFNPGYHFSDNGIWLAPSVVGLLLSPEIGGSVAANLIRLLGGSALSTTEATGLVALSEALVPATAGETAYIIAHGGTLAPRMGAILLYLQNLKKAGKVTKVTLLVCKAAKKDKEAIQVLTSLGYSVNASNSDLAVVFGIVLFAEWADPLP